MISIVVPAHNEERNIELLHKSVCTQMQAPYGDWESAECEMVIVDVCRATSGISTLCSRASPRRMAKP